MEHIEGTMEVVGIDFALTEIIVSIANELTQLRLANDVAVMKQHDLTWERLYELKGQSIYEYQRWAQEETE